MRKKTFNRMIKRIHDMNEGVLSIEVVIKKLSENQNNYNPILREYYGERQWEIVAETNGIIDAFKESETWHENGVIGIHDYKLSVNNNLFLNVTEENINNYIVERKDNGIRYEITFYREFIGEVHLGLRPVKKND